MASVNRKTWPLLLALLALAIIGYVASGPYWTIRAIRGAVQANDAATLSDNVDFPALRASLKAQLEDRVVRSAGSDVQATLIGALGLSIADGVVDAAVDTMVTPLGLGALMQGRVLWSRVASPTASDTTRRAPLQGALYRYESPSRFTATVHTQSGAPVVMVLTRHGLHWRLSDLRLPPQTRSASTQ